VLLLTLAGSIEPEKGMEPRLQVEAVERVDDVEVLAVGHPDRAVRLGQIDAQQRVVAQVQRREAIARERAGGGRREAEEGLDSGRKGESRQQDDGGQGQEGEIAAEANAHARTPFGQQSLHCHCDNEGMTGHEYYRDGGGVNRGRALPAAAVLQAPSLRRVSASWVAIVRGRREPNEP